MAVTKNLAELCALLIDDVYGELPSRIFTTLLSRGRSTTSQLKQHTSLTQRQLRHGLAVLIQYNLIYVHLDEDEDSTWYEGNPQAAYNLSRAGRTLDFVEHQHNSAAKDVVNRLQCLGQTRISDLQAAYRAKIDNLDRKAEELSQDPFASEDEDRSQTEKSLAVNSVGHLDAILCDLIRADLVEVVTTDSFSPPADLHLEVESMIKKRHYPQEIKAKQRDEFEELVATRLREIRDLPKMLKRSLEANGVGRSKIRKLMNGDIANGYHGSDAETLDPETVVRVNYEKIMVELRNQRLVHIASDVIGETTGQVYAALLGLISKPIPRCRLDSRLDKFEQASERLVGQRSISTVDVFDHLDASIDVSVGIGKVEPAQVDIATAERFQKHPSQGQSNGPKKIDEAEVDGEASTDEDEDMDDIDWDSEAEAIDSLPPKSSSRVNGTRPSKVTFEDSEQSRQIKMRQHLLLLCESKYQFVRHCGRGSWTVDFQPLLRYIQEMELDNVIESKVGRQGLRLARILREKGKLDEKALAFFAMMKKGDVQKTMLQMQMHGFADVQEVPRDGSRIAGRIYYLWFCNVDKSIGQLLDNTYKAMLRSLQIREVMRQGSKEVLAFVERPDVKGREKDALEKKYFDKYEKFRDAEAKLLGQATRLDDLVATLRDY